MDDLARNFELNPQNGLTVTPFYLRPDLKGVAPDGTRSHHSHHRSNGNGTFPTAPPVETTFSPLASLSSTIEAASNTFSWKTVTPAEVHLNNAANDKELWLLTR